MPSKKKSQNESKKGSSSHSRKRSTKDGTSPHHSRPSHHHSRTRFRHPRSRSHSRRTIDDVLPKSAGRDSRTTPAVFESSIPAFRSRQCEHSAGSPTANITFSASTPSTVPLPPLRANTCDGNASPQRCRAVGTVRRRYCPITTKSTAKSTTPTAVTIPRGLLPKEVPQPLRAVERRGKALTTPHTSVAAASDDDLYARWVNAYTYGTAAPGEYSFYKFSDKMGDEAEEGERRRVVETFLPSASNATRNSPATEVSAPGKTTLLPDQTDSSDADSVESYINRAGYFFVSGEPLGSNVTDKRVVSAQNDNGGGDADATAAEELTKKGKQGEMASKKQQMEWSDKLTPLERVSTLRASARHPESEAVRTTSAPLLSKQQRQEKELSSPGQRLQPSVTPFRAGVSAAQPKEPVVKSSFTSPAAKKEVHSENEGRVELMRVWTPSSELPEGDEQLLTTTQDLYPMLSNSSKIYASTPAAAAELSSAPVPPPRNKAQLDSPPYPSVRHRERPASLGELEWLLEMKSSLQVGDSLEVNPVAPSSTLKSLPHMGDGIEADPDMSDNDSRHLVSVRRLPGGAEGGSSGGDSLLMMHGAGTDRVMGNEAETILPRSDAENQRKGRGSHQTQSQLSIPASERLKQPGRHVAQESSLLAMDKSVLTTPTDSNELSSTSSSQQQLLRGDKELNKWTCSASRFSHHGHGAAALGAQRVLTLLMVKGTTTAPKLTKEGAQVFLVASPGFVAKTVTVDEAVPVKDGDVTIPSSTLLREIAAEVRDGHCAVLLLSVAAGCGAVASVAVENTLVLLLAAMAQRQAEARGECEQQGGLADIDTSFYFKMEVSIVLINKGNFTKDLIVNREEELGMVAPAQPIANPILGSWCDNTMFQSVRSSSQIKTLLQPVRTWLVKPPEEAEKAKEVVCVYVALRQARNTTDLDDDDRTLTLSSLLIYVTRAQDGVVGILHNREAATPLQRSLLRRVGDGCFTVNAACVQAGADSAPVYANLCAEACTFKNHGYLSGDVRRYMEKLREAKAREETAAQATAGAGDASKRHRSQQRRDLCNDLLHGMALLVRDPVNCTIPFYPDRIAAREKAAEGVEGDDGSGNNNGSNPAAATVSSGVLTHCVLPSTHNVHIPNTIEALEIFGDCRVHTVAICSSKKACGYEPIRGTDSGLRRLADGATFRVDELHPRRILPPLHTFPITTHTSGLCTLFINGYNAALASFDGCTSNVFSSPAWYVLAEAVGRALNGSDVRRRTLRIAFSVVRDSGEALDLLDPGSTTMPLQVASSPLFGTAVYTSELHPITSQETLRDLLYTVASKAASAWTPNAFLHVLLVSLFSTGDDVFVSSFNLSVFGSHATVCQRILSNGRSATDGGVVSAPVHPEVLRLHYGLLSGAAASVFLVTLNNREDSDLAMTIADKDVSLLSKGANRSGSVREFIRRTRNGLEKQRLKSSSAPAVERAYLARMERRITDMLDDNAALLAPDSKAFPRAYLVDHVAAVPQPPAEQQQQQRTEVATAAVAAVPKNSSSAYKRRPQRDDSMENGMSVSHHSPSSGKTSAAEEISEAATPTVNVSRPHWVLGVELGGSAAMEVQASGTELEWVPTKERFDTDGILFYNSAQSDVKYLFTENCEPMQRMREHARAARSCAILGLMDGSGAGPELHVRTQPLWSSFTALVLNAAFLSDDSGSTWKGGSELHIRMCAVQDRTLLYDFLIDREDAAAGTSTELPAKVALAANPLFGPVVRNTTVMRAGSLKECQCVFRNGLDALNSLAGEYPSGTVLIASAVLKNVTDDDIFFSSISAFGVRIGKDLPALRDILAMDPRGGAPPSLYQYALRGPCHLLCLTTLDSSANAHCVGGLRLSQGIRYGTTVPVPAGSLCKCLQEQQDVLAHSTHLSSQIRANTEHVVKQLVKMKNDPFAPIVIFPFYDDTVSSPSGLSLHGTFNLHSGSKKVQGGPPLNGPGSPSLAVGGGACCRVTAVITAAGRDETPTLDTRTETNTVRMAQSSYLFTEVVLRANNSSVLRPELITSIVQHVQQGRNTTLVVADGVGSNAGASLLSKLVSVFIRNTGDNGHGVNTTLFMSITAVRFPAPNGGKGGGAMVKDLFSAETQFDPLQVARSPFFGTCVNGARFSSLNRIGDVYLTLKDAQRACCYLKATLVVAIVLKQVMRAANGAVQDVLMSSLFSVLSTAETSNGAYACKAFDDMLNQREAALAATTPDDPRAVAWRSCLLAQAFGGESFTYGVVGLTGNASEAEAAAMLKFSSRLMQVPYRVPVQSSAMKILELANRKLPRGSNGSPGLGAKETLTTVSNAPWDWREIKAEAEDMLNSPDTCKPRAFLCD